MPRPATIRPALEKAGTSELVLDVRSNGRAPEAARVLEPLFYRGVTVHLPIELVRAPLPTLTFRHLDKVGRAALEGRRDRVVAALQRAIASAHDVASLLKIAVVALGEGAIEEVSAALARAWRGAQRDPEALEVVREAALAMGHPVPGQPS